MTQQFSLFSIFDYFCLRVEGTRVTAGGGVVPVSGSVCFRFSPVITGALARSTPAERPLLPLTELADGKLRVVGHFDPWAPGRAPSKGHAHLLLYFAEQGEEAAALLREALGTARKGEAAILPMVVLPPGGPRGQGPSDGILLVEDRDGRWADALGVSEPPACVLVGPRGDVLWKEESGITPKKLAGAIDKYAKDAGEVPSTPIGLAVRLGERSPDAPLRLADGSELSLRRLKGRPVALTFFSSRSEPSLDHLEFLRDLQASRGSRAPLVIAIGDGETSERVAEIGKERELPYLVLPDPDRFISRIYGVWCWPATVWIRADQRVEAVDFGMATR